MHAQPIEIEIEIDWIDWFNTIGSNPNPISQICTYPNNPIMQTEIPFAADLDKLPFLIHGVKLSLRCVRKLCGTVATTTATALISPWKVKVKHKTTCTTLRYYSITLDFKPLSCGSAGFRFRSPWIHSILSWASDHRRHRMTSNYRPQQNFDGNHQVGKLNFNKHVVLFCSRLNSQLFPIPKCACDTIDCRNNWFGNLQLATKVPFPWLSNWKALDAAAVTWTRYCQSRKCQSQLPCHCPGAALRN